MRLKTNLKERGGRRFFGGRLPARGAGTKNRHSLHFVNSPDLFFMHITFGGTGQGRLFFRRMPCPRMFRDLESEREWRGEEAGRDEDESVQRAGIEEFMALDFLFGGFMDHVLRRGSHDSGRFGRGALGCAPHRAFPEHTPFHRGVGPTGRSFAGRRHGVDETKASGTRNGAQHDIGGPVYRCMALPRCRSPASFPLDQMGLPGFGDRFGRFRCGHVHRFPVGSGTAGRLDPGFVGADGLVDQPHPDNHGSFGIGDRRVAWWAAFRRDIPFFAFDWTRHACFDTILGEAFEECCGKRCSS